MHVELLLRLLNNDDKPALGRIGTSGAGG
jgi:hypothetical protein